MNQNSLDRFDTEKMQAVKGLVDSVYEYNFKSRKDPLSAKLETILKKIDHIIEEYGVEDK